jgi:hypothetical protein
MADPQEPKPHLFAQLENYVNRNLTMDDIETFRESCPVQVVTHGIMGFAVGGMFGLFMSSINPAAAADAASTTGTTFSSQTVKSIFRDMATNTWRTAKNLGMVAALFSGIECILETHRAKHDIYNTAIAGCTSGAILGARGGPKGVLYGCAGFAAFSTAVEYFLQRRTD